MDIYKYKGCYITVLQLIIYRLGESVTRKKVHKFNVSSLGDNKNLINVSKFTEGINKLIPLTNKYSTFGVILKKEVYFNNGESIKNITLIDGNKINFLEKINKYLFKGKMLID